MTSSVAVELIAEWRAQAYQARREKEATRVLERKGPEAHQGLQDLQVKVELAAPGHQDPPANEAHLAIQVSLVHRVLLANLVTVILLLVLGMMWEGQSLTMASTPEGGYGDATDQDIPIVQLPHNSYQIYDPEELYDGEQQQYVVHGSYPQPAQYPQSSYPDPRLAQPEFTPVREEMEAIELRSPGISRFTRKISKRSVNSPLRKRAIKKNS